MKNFSTSIQRRKRAKRTEYFARLTYYDKTGKRKGVSKSAATHWEAKRELYDNPDSLDHLETKDVAEPTSEDWTDYMRKHPEADTRRKLCESLGDMPKADWGANSTIISCIAPHSG